MVYFFKTPSPKAGWSVRFASSPAKSGRRLLGPTNLKSTVGQYSCTDHTNTVMVARLEPPVQGWRRLFERVKILASTLDGLQRWYHDEEEQ